MDNKIDKIIQDISQSVDVNNVIVFDEIKKAWTGLSQIINLNAYPIYFKNGVLTIKAKELTWKKQLIKLKPNLLVQLNRYFGKEVIKDIDFLL